MDNIITLLDDNGNVAAPKTKAEAVYLGQNSISGILSNVPQLRDPLEYTTPTPRDADMLGGQYTADDITEVIENLSQINDFSNETVVGTLNDKPIYRKVVIYNGSPTPSTWVVIDTIKNSDIEYLLSMNGAFYSLKYSCYYATPYMYNEYVDFIINKEGLKIMNKFGSEISKVLVVLYYTKASS